jgi:hypothetical protein
VRIPFGTAHLPSDQIKDDLRPSVMQRERVLAQPSRDSAHSHSFKVSQQDRQRPSDVMSVVGSKSPACAKDITGSRRSSDPGSAASSEGDRSRARSSSLDSFDAARHPQRPAKPPPRARILLADDNDDMREYVARLLSAKYDVIKVANGTHTQRLEAFALLSRAPRAFSRLVTTPQARKQCTCLSQTATTAWTWC